MPQDLSEALKEATQAVHTQAENVEFLRNFQRGQVTRKGFKVQVAWWKCPGGGCGGFPGFKPVTVEVGIVEVGIQGQRYLSREVMRLRSDFLKVTASSWPME